MKEDQEFREVTKLQSGKYLIKCLIKYLFIKFPWLWLLMLLILPLVVGWIAYDLLTYPEYTGYGSNFDQKESLETVNFPVEAMRTTSINNGNISNGNGQEIPLWLMLAIAICCSAGCLVIYIILHSAKPVRKTSKPVQKR